MAAMPITMSMSTPIGSVALETLISTMIHIGMILFSPIEVPM